MLMADYIAYHKVYIFLISIFLFKVLFNMSFINFGKLSPKLFLDSYPIYKLTSSIAVKITLYKQNYNINTFVKIITTHLSDKIKKEIRTKEKAHLNI